MSKIGKKPIEVPEAVEIVENGNMLKIKGILGESQLNLSPKIKINRENGKIIVAVNKIDKTTKPLWGTFRTLLSNKITGVSKGFEKNLILEGLGYSVGVQSNQLVFKLGYNHPVFLAIPDNLTVEAKPQRNFYLISVKGIDKEEVGKFAGRIRKLKPAEPYKGKGFRYSDEKIRRKAVRKLGKT